MTARVRCGSSWLLLGGLLAALGAGCAGTRPRGEPHLPVEVLRMVPSFGEDGRGQLELDLQVEAAPAPGEILGMQCEVLLNDRWFAAAQGLLVGPLPAGAPVPVHLRVPWAIRRISGPPPGEEPVDVEVRGSLEVRRGQGTQKLPFSKRQRLVLNGAPTKVTDEPL